MRPATPNPRTSDPLPLNELAVAFGFQTHIRAGDLEVENNIAFPCEREQTKYSREQDCEGEQ